LFVTAYEGEKHKPAGANQRLLKGLGIALLFIVLILWRVLWALLIQVALGALVMAAALPACRRMEKKMPRSVAASLSLLLLSGTVVAFALLFVPLLLKQVGQLAAMLPDILSQLRVKLESVQAFLARQGLPMDGSQKMMLDKIQEMAGTALPTLMAKVGSWAGSLSKLFLAPVFAFYFLRDREDLGQRLSLWIPLKYRRKSVAVTREMRREISGFWRGQLMISGVVGGLTALGLLIVGVPAWLLLGLLMGLLELIPYIGPFLGAIPVFLFSLPLGWGRVTWALVVVVLVQQLEGGMISPYLMSGATRLHPVTVLLAISAGGLLGGVAGMLLAVPVVVSLRGGLRMVRRENTQA
jgi:predicted PurR-regulated permease PerM